MGPPPRPVRGLGGTGSLARDLARDALAAIRATPIRLPPAAEHATPARAIAFDLDQTAYSSLYLAAALVEHATLITADEAFAAAALRHGAYAPSVRRLAA